MVSYSQDCEGEIAEAVEYYDDGEVDSEGADVCVLSLAYETPAMLQRLTVVIQVIIIPSDKEIIG